MILVEYGCGSCGTPSDRWVQTPVPPRLACSSCGSVAKRRFGGALVAGRSADEAQPRRQQKAPAPVSGCSDHSGMPGCVLTPTAARALSARMRKDNRALEKELAYQESAIASGHLDVTAPPVLASPGHIAPEQKAAMNQ